jgi:hypothetical protein
MERFESEILPESCLSQVHQTVVIAKRRFHTQHIGFGPAQEDPEGKGHPSTHPAEKKRSQFSMPERSLRTDLKL